jgi:Spy/CpxP family protein refolding chaperone
MKQALLAFILIGSCAFAQGPPPGGDWNHDDRHGPPPQHRSSFGAPPGRWWRDPGIVHDLTLTADQQKHMDDIYQQNRLRLIDLTATLQKQEALVEPMLAADHVDETRTLAQVDRVAQARAELEKANARMLLGFRGVLSLDQWKRLQAGPPHPSGPPPGGPPTGQVR